MVIYGCKAEGPYEDQTGARDMKTYKVTVNTGYKNVRMHVFVRTSAKTDAGIARAIGTQIAKSLETDVFEVIGIIWRDGVASNYSIRDWHTMNHKRYDHMIWAAAHDALMDGALV